MTKARPSSVLVELPLPPNLKKEAADWPDGGNAFCSLTYVSRRLCLEVVGKLKFLHRSLRCALLNTISSAIQFNLKI